MLRDAKRPSGNASAMHVEVPHQHQARAWYGPYTSKPDTDMHAGFTPAERDFIRRELDMFLTTLPSVADGFHLRTWRSGPLTGQPKIPAVARHMVARGLMRLDAALRPPRMIFTEGGLAALRTMMGDARLANPAKFAHVRQELGIDVDGPQL